MGKYWVNFSFLSEIDGPVILKRMSSDDLDVMSDVYRLLLKLKRELNYSDFEYVGEDFHVSCDNVTKVWSKE